MLTCLIGQTRAKKQSSVCQLEKEKYLKAITAINKEIHEIYFQFKIDFKTIKIGR